MARAVEVETTDELVIAGRVVDRREHRPTAGALVAARVSANGRTKPFKPAVTTDADGGFAFTTTAQEWTHKLKGDFVYFRIAFGDPLRTVDTRDSRRWQPPGPAGTFEIYVDNVLPRRLAGTVTDWRGRPGEGLTVAAERDGQVLGSALTDAAGHYDLEFPGEAAPLEAAVYTGAGELLARSGVKDGGGVRLTRNVKLPSPVDSLAAVSAALAEPLPQPLLAALAEAGLDTLAALRGAGGVPVGLAGKDPAQLNRIVALSVVDAPPTDLAALADAGIPTLTDLARRPPDELARLLAPKVAPDRVEVYRRRAGSALVELANRIIEKRLDPGTPTPVSDDFAGLFRISCDCGCTAATGPQAYLAHLLRFAVAGVRYNGAAIDIGFLQDRFRQPLRDLPTTCDTAEHEVAQARIAVEILRKHLAGLGNAAAASASPAWYGEAAYLELLQYLDLDYDELRKVSRRPAAGRARFTFQHGLGADPTDSGPFDDLYRDLAAPAGSGREPSEDWLGGFFGLRSTLADPLRPDGPDARALELRRASLRAGWVEADAAATRPLGRVPLVDPDLVSELDLVDRTPRLATDDVPSWRPLDFLARRRRELQNAEALIASWLSPNPLQAAAQQYKNLLLDLTSAQGFLPGSAIPVPPYGFSAGGRALDYLRMKGLRDDAAAGLDVSADLDAFAISLEDVQAIGGFVEVLEQNLPVTADERLRIGRILLAHVKRAGFWPVWLSQEAVNARDPHGQLALEPGKFRLRVLAGEAPDPAWTASPPLAESAERQAWEDILRSRTSAIEALSGDLADRIRAVEARLLPQMRDQLIVSSQPAGVTILRTTDALTDHYQVDFAAGPCQRTTRVSQAIETVQGLLFSARNGLFDEPGWTLAIDEFDAVWRWLGTFETWLAAITAFLFCENLLRPSLRGDPSPGFSAALEQMRDADPIGLADAAAAYTTFAGYLNDVAALEPLAWIELPLATAGHSATLLVGATAGSAARRFYWSLAIEQPDGAGDQGWWRRLEPMDGVDGVAGGARCGAYAVVLTASTLASTRSLDLWRLPLPGPDGSDGALLAAAPEWEGPFGLELPDGVNSFLSVSLDAGGVVTIEADETTTYTRPLDRDGRSWACRFRATRQDALWRRYRESDDYGVTPANQSTFACQGDGLLHSVPGDRFVLTADVDADGADELVAFGGADGFWALEMVAVGPYAAWLPLGTRPLTRHYDVALGDAKHTLFFTVHGDFDGDGAQEIAAFVESDPPPGAFGGITTTWMDLYVRKWVAATAAWSELGGRGPAADSQLLVRADRLAPRACAVGRFTQSRRDEILVAYHDHSSAGEVTDLQVFGLVGGAWQSVAYAQISDFVPCGHGPVRRGDLRGARGGRRDRHAADGAARRGRPRDRALLDPPVPRRPVAAPGRSRCGPGLRRPAAARGGLRRGRRRRGRGHRRREPHPVLQVRGERLDDGAHRDDAGRGRALDGRGLRGHRCRVRDRRLRERPDGGRAGAHGGTARRRAAAGPHARLRRPRASRRLRPLRRRPAGARAGHARRGLHLLRAGEGQARRQRGDAGDPPLQTLSEPAVSPRPRRRGVRARRFGGPGRREPRGVRRQPRQPPAQPGVPGGGLLFPAGRGRAAAAVRRQLPHRAGLAAARRADSRPHAERRQPVPGARGHRRLGANGAGRVRSARRPRRGAAAGRRLQPLHPQRMGPAAGRLRGLGVRARHHGVARARARAVPQRARARGRAGRRLRDRRLRA